MLKLKNKKEKTSSKKTDKKKKDTFTVLGFNYDNMVQTLDDENTNALVKYEGFLADDGDNLLLVMPGTEETNGDIMKTRITHGFPGSSCVRVSRSDRWEECPKCQWWGDNRSTKEERDRKEPKKLADDYYPSTRGNIQVIDITWAAEHKKVKKGGEIIERIKSTEIDIDRIKKCSCFMDESKLNPESEKCKNCIAFKSCFQGPQFLALSSKRITDFNRELGRLGGSKSVKVGNSKVALKGNIALSWWTMLLDATGKKGKEAIKAVRAIAQKVSFPLIYTKKVNPDLPKEFGTEYAISFSRSEFIIPATWQERTFARSRSLAEYCKPIVAKQAQAELKAWLKSKQGSDDDKPECYNDVDIKDGVDCDEEACSHYESCCKKTIKKNDKNKKPKGKTKQTKATKDITIDDDDFSLMDEDKMIEMLKNKHKQNKAKNKKK